MGDDMYSFGQATTVDLGNMRDALRTANARRLPTAAGPTRTANANAPPRAPPRTAAANRLGTASGMRTAMGSRAGPGARPTTSMKSNQASNYDDGMSKIARDRLALLSDQPLKETLEMAVRKTERNVHRLLEESALAAAAGNYEQALTKAKEASSHETLLKKDKDRLYAEQTASRSVQNEYERLDQQNADLTYAVQVHLGCMYEKNGLLREAARIFKQVIDNKLFDKAGRLRVNLGNIFFRQGEYLKAVQQYRQALDKIPDGQHSPESHQAMRNEVRRNIALSFMKMGCYSDAISSLEEILEQTPTTELEGEEVRLPGSDFAAALNLIICYFALGDARKMAETFQRMLLLEIVSPRSDDRYENFHNDPRLQVYLDAVKNDMLHRDELAQRQQAEKYISTAARLIAPALDANNGQGFTFCLEALAKSKYNYLSHDLEIAKAVGYIKSYDFSNAIESLKSFGKKDSLMHSTAATNLSFLYFLEGQYALADKSVSEALEADRYNPQALVNKGNCLFVNKDIAKAIEYYNMALDSDSSCIEAIYNLGLAHKRLQNYFDARECFEKVCEILPTNTDAVYQIAHCYELAGDMPQAFEWYTTFLSRVPTDSNVLSHLGSLYDADPDEESRTSAFQFNMEAHRCFPADLNTIKWLGGYYIDSKFYEKAVEFLEKAAEVQPGNVSWRLMIGGCYRRSGNYQRALEVYKDINRDFPDNIDCLSYLVRISTDQQLPEAKTFAAMLKKAERAQEQREQRENKRNSRKAGAGRRGTNGKENQENDGQVAPRERGDPILPQKRATNANAAGAASNSSNSSSYQPMAHLAERPRTASIRPVEDDEWANETLGDDMLPE